MANSPYRGSDPTIIWFDPGGATGWALFSVHPDALLDPDVFVLDNILHFSCGEFYGSEFRQVDQMLDLVDSWPIAAIGCEDFILMKLDKSRELLAPVRLAAALRYTLMPERWVHMQAPSMMDGMSDERLRRLPYWKATAGLKDARAATKHALVFLRRAKSQPALCKEAFPYLFE
jgi:hypothetical protein